MIGEFDLKLDPLLTMAKIIRGADTSKLNLAPQCAGLLALAVGNSRIYKNDIELPDASLPLYDALFRWARDGINETHEWVVADAR